MEKAKLMIELIESTKNNGDSIGGIIKCIIKNCPAGLGEPVFDKLSAQLAKAMLSINACKGFEYGDGFDFVNKNGSNYDGVIIKNTTDYGGKVEEYKPANVYVTFDANQFKSYDNTTPTEDPDLRYSLSNNEDIAPVGKYNVYGKDVKVQKAPKRTIKAPVKQQQQITGYHGTRGDFEEFDNKRIGQNYEGDWSSLGKGFYFTYDSESAKEFGKVSTNEGEVTVTVTLFVPKAYSNSLDVVTASPFVPVAVSIVSPPKPLLVTNDNE
jgi:hypothetical protein